MTRAICNRADLVRVLFDCESMLVDAADLLGYEKVPSKLPLESDSDYTHDPMPAASSIVPPELESSLDSESWPANQMPISFWVLNYFAQLDVTTKEDPPQRHELIWREQDKQKSPPWQPICEWPSLVPRLRSELTQSSGTSRVDVPKAVMQLAEGKLINNIPRQSVRRWGSELELIIDRSQRLTPFYQDQDWFLLQLQTVMPRSSIQLVIYDEVGDRLMRIESRGKFVAYKAPDPTVPIVILSDLGALGVIEGTSIWHYWSERWLPRDAPVLAVVPCSPARVLPSLRNTLKTIPWQKLVLTQNGLDVGKRKSLVDRLFRYLSPAKRVEPGLLRAVRRLMPEACDASLEVDFWQDARLASRNSRAATLEPDVQHAFTALSVEARCRALETIRDWRHQLAPEIWMSEIWGLDGESEALLSKSDRQDAKAWQESFVAMESDEKSDALVAWLARATANLQKSALGRQKHLRELHRRLHQHSDLLGGHPSELERGKEVQIAIGQSGDSLVCCPVDSLDIEKPTFQLHGFARTSTGALSITELECREVSNFWKDGAAPKWAKEWGHDEFGPWAEFEVRGQNGSVVRQLLRWIRAGTFLMGSHKDEADRRENEDQREVTLTRGYWMFDTPVTQELWRAIVGTEPSSFKEDRLPVEQVSWHDSQNFLKRLNQQFGGDFMSLPTEAQWEWACRAGTTTPYSFGSVCNGTQANCDGNYPYGTQENGPYLRKTSIVGSYPANPWGLFDMHGNVWEWCEDWYAPYSLKDSIDPRGPSNGRSRVLRGGSWDFHARLARSACRLNDVPGYRSNDVGFRCAQVQGAAEPTREDGGRRRRLHPTSGGGAEPVKLQAGKVCATPMPQSSAVRIESDVEQLELIKITKPNWASAMGRDRYGLWAEFTVEVEKPKPRRGPQRPKRMVVTQRMRWIPPGRFSMGSTESDDQAFSAERPSHEVTLNHGYWLFDTPVTQALWQAVMPENPSEFKGIERPVENVSWKDCQRFLSSINKLMSDKQSDFELVLPTEAEWEYACRAGTATRYWFGDVFAPHHANCWESELRETTQVKKFASNPWGLYDMHGNVWEWCQDWYGEYVSEAVRNPLGPIEGRYRVLRGVSWRGNALYARSACRNGHDPGNRGSLIGFRCAQVQKESRVSELTSERLATSGSEASK